MTDLLTLLTPVTVKSLHLTVSILIREVMLIVVREDAAMVCYIAMTVFFKVG